MDHYNRLDLLVILPTKNPNKSIFNCIESFLKIKNKSSMMIIVDNGDEINLEGFFELIKKNDSIKYFKIENQNNDNYVNYVEKYPNIIEKVFGKIENYPKYFTAINDDDAFYSTSTIENAIDILDNDITVSYVVSPILEQDEKGNKKIFDHVSKKLSNIDFLKLWFEEKYSFDFRIDEAYISHCLHGAIWRLEEMINLECFKSIELYKKKLWDGFGLDFTWYIKPISKIGSYVYLLGGEPSKVYNTRIESMTTKFPIMFSYCYFSYLIHCYDWLKNKKDFIDNKILKIFIIRWINQMFSSYFAVHTLNKLEKYNSPVEIYLNQNFLKFVYRQCFKFLSFKTISMMLFWTKKSYNLRKNV
jgi:hypothetical protein